MISVRFVGYIRKTMSPRSAQLAERPFRKQQSATLAEGFLHPRKIFLLAQTGAFSAQLALEREKN